jgi:alpha-glucosidase
MKYTGQVKVDSPGQNLPVMCKQDGQLDHVMCVLQTGSPDLPRLTSKKGREYTNVLLMLLMLLPGAARSFQGEELGLGDTILDFPASRDLRARLAGRERYRAVTRDYSRGPVPWTQAGKHWGFTTAEEPWLPFANGTADRDTVQVKLQGNVIAGCYNYVDRS